MNAENEVPFELYRGDADKYGTRKLKDTIHFFQLQTNLINSGQGRKIHEEPLQELIKKHVGIGWQQTHFLSFSSICSTAFGYGCGNMDMKVTDQEDYYSESFEDTREYDFALITFHTDKVKWREIEPGVYEGLFAPSLKMFSRITDNYRAILIDVVTVLTRANSDEDTMALANATRDKEWLLLPATHILLNSDQVEYSAIFDAACISYRKYISK
jgi:hypothetical protein